MLSGVHTDHVATKSLRWGAFAAADGRSGRDRLLDAAERCLEVQGLAGTTMEDIARNAGVSRATVYRYFASREAVISGVIIRATEEYLRRMEPRLSGHSDLGSAIVDFIDHTVIAARRRPIIGVLFGSDRELAGVGLAEGKSTMLFELVTEFLRPLFATHWNQLAPGVSVDDAAEWILRTVLSLLTVRGPRDRSRDGLRTYLQRLLLPAIVSSQDAT
ncbi:putative transcriptional regulator, TetR [Mycolicibacterium moriokaense]|uniref:Transcriptional regulator, TetR n=1 Tax=Mycolicibacterium moriokaense TaxID=39691 RepID=A0AAD1M784_9MYCO|nr:putative transcriptional regulator, TetR [Mycolicibacterium moriokaense]